MDRLDAEWAAGAGDQHQRGSARPLPGDAHRRGQGAFHAAAGELRGYLTVVPESRWIKHAAHQEWFFGETTEHYEEHAEGAPGDPRGRLVTGQPGNGHFDPADDDGLDDDTPLDAPRRRRRPPWRQRRTRASTSASRRVVEELDGVVRRRDGDAVTYLADGVRPSPCSFRTPWRSSWTRPSRRPR